MQYYEEEGKIRYYESPAWGEWCRRVYGIDLKQIGAVTKGELELFFHEVNLLPESHVLDIGCGAGYISAAVARHYHSFVTGIDIDKYAIAHAKNVFSDNPMLHYQVADGNEISLNASSLDLISFFDTLYFTAAADKLRLLLDKSLLMLKTGGKLAVFWSGNPMDEVRKPAFYDTQVGLWGVKNDIPFKAFDLTESNKAFWRKAKMEIISMEKELQKEIPQTYKQVLQECIHAEENEENIFQWLYIFTRQ